MGFSKSSAKREVHSNTSLSQKTRETSNKQPNFTPKQLEKEKKNPKFSRRKKNCKNQSRNKWGKNEEDYGKNQQN